MLDRTFPGRIQCQNRTSSRSQEECEASPGFHLNRQYKMNGSDHNESRPALSHKNLLEKGL